MGQIIRIEGTDIYIQMSDQKVVKAPITAVNYPNPQVGDQISIIKNGNTMYIARANAPAAAPAPQPQAQQYQQQQYQQYQQPSEVSMESEAGGVCASPSYVPSSIGPYSAPQPSAPLPTYSTVYGSANPSTQVFEPAYSSSYPTAPPPQPPS